MNYVNTLGGVEMSGVLQVIKCKVCKKHVEGVIHRNFKTCACVYTCTCGHVSTYLNPFGVTYDNDGNVEDDHYNKVHGVS